MADAVRNVFMVEQEPVRVEQIAAHIGMQEPTVYKWLRKAMDAGLVRREDRGKYAPSSGPQSYIGALQVLPTPNEVVELDPSLGEGLELVDPVTGEELFNSD